MQNFGRFEAFYFNFFSCISISKNISLRRKSFYSPIIFMFLHRVQLFLHRVQSFPVRVQLFPRRKYKISLGENTFAS